MLAGEELEVHAPPLAPTPDQLADHRPLPLEQYRATGRRFVARNERGYRIGESHHRTKYAETVRLQALQWHEAGLGSARIVDRLRILLGVRVARSTVIGWLSGDIRGQAPRPREG